MEEVFVVGLHKSGSPPDVAWDIVGIFTIEEKAILECKTVNHFYGPIKLNKMPDAGEKIWEVNYPVTWPERSI